MSAAMSLPVNFDSLSDAELALLIEQQAPVPPPAASMMMPQQQQQQPVQPPMQPQMQQPQYMQQQYVPPMQPQVPQQPQLMQQPQQQMQMPPMQQQMQMQMPPQTNGRMQMVPPMQQQQQFEMPPSVSVPQPQPQVMQSSRPMDPRLAKSLATRSVDVCFVVDCTGSMTQWLDQVKAKVVSITSSVMQHERVAAVRLAFVGYRDYIYPSNERYVVFPFIDNAQQFAAQIADVQALYCKGNDEPEDLLGGLDQALKLQWQSFTRVIILIADAPCHGGTEYHDLQESRANASYNDPLRADTLLRAMGGAKFNIDLTFCRIKADTDKMIVKFKQFYNDPTKKRTLKEIQLDSNEDDFLPKIVATITESVNRANRR